MKRASDTDQKPFWLFVMVAPGAESPAHAGTQRRGENARLHLPVVEIGSGFGSDFFYSGYKGGKGLVK
jgi:hypothetical protein